MGKRVSIRSTEAASGAAADLVAILQSITADGRIGNGEINALHQWLRKNKDCGLPAIEYLTVTIESLTADGKVTDKERAELTKAVERVLPLEVREFAAQKRRLRTLQEREAAEAAAAAREAELAKSAPIGSMDFVVAGTAFEGRLRIASRMRAGDSVFLIRDRKNRFSPNAIQVRTGTGADLGFVPEPDAIAAAPYLDRGYRLRSRVKRMWQGRNGLIPVIEADVFPPDTLAPDTYDEASVPTATRRRFPWRLALIGLAIWTLLAVGFFNWLFD